MSGGFERKPGASTLIEGAFDGGSGTPGKRTLTEQLGTQASAVALQRQAGQPNASAEDAAAAAVEHKAGGAAVNSGVADRVGSHLGADFSGVRVHQDPHSQGATSAMGARAFTYGNDVFLGPHESGSDRNLMAHELTHVVQQGAAGQRSPQRQLQVGDANSPAEHEADQVAAAVTSGTGQPNRDSAATPVKIGPQVQRAPDQNKTTTAAGPTPDEQAAMTFDGGLGYDAVSIKSIQRLVGASESGTFDLATIQKITTWQAGRSLTGKGQVDPATLKAIVLAMVAASKHDDAIHLIVNAYRLPTTNLASISYDAATTSADAITSGTIATNSPQTVKVGPSTFAGSYEHAVKIIGHELQHVQQRTGAAPITNANAREFLSYAWEALDTTTPALTAAERVNHCNIAIGRYNLLSDAEKLTYKPTYDKLQALIAAGGGGNP